MQGTTLTPAEAAQQLQWRRAARTDLVSWAKHFGADRGWSPAKHHSLLLEKLQEVTEGRLIHPETGRSCSNLIVLLPPGSAKSSYISICFPPWFLQRKKHQRILACSCKAELIESFSRECRNGIELHSKVLGMSLQNDSRAVGEWSTDNFSSYHCTGVGSALSGRRADCGFIDDYIGSQEDADSELIREKQWLWYQNDFSPRLKPNAIQIIVANRRHEEDLVGKLTSRFPKDWVVVSIPFFPDTDNDVLGRPKVDKDACLAHVDMSTVQVTDLENDPKVFPLLDSRIWPDFFTRKQAAEVLLKPPRTYAGLYQQRPTPEDGDYFKKDWLREYTREEYDALMAKNPRIYGAGDWAVSEEKDANRSCFGGVAMDENGILFVLPDIFWKQAGPKEVVRSYVDFLKRRNPIQFWSEKGHISKSWGPFLQEAMLDEEVYNYITEVTPSRDKEVRAQSIRGRMSMLRVRFPTFASWWPAAMHELLMFPGGKSDDFVDFIAHIGMGINNISRASAVVKKQRRELGDDEPMTFAWLKDHDKKVKQSRLPKYAGR